MGFKKFEETFPPRFKEFDEARKYIENIDLENNLTYEAIDYMISHREYFFLLKNVINQFADNNKGTESFFDYVFSRLDNCPKRKEDINLYKKILTSKNKKLKKAFLMFAKKCSEDFKDFALNLIEDKDLRLKRYGFCILLSAAEKDESIKELLKSFILNNELNKKDLEEFINYVYFYGSKEDKNCLEKLKEKFPKLKEEIEKVEEVL